VPASVSIIIPSYEGESHLQGLLEALEAQEAHRAWEVILVLDGSTDGSRAIAETFTDRMNLTLIARTENQGRAATLNEGFAAAAGDVLVRCDDDLLPSSTYVEQYGSVIEDHPQLGLIGLVRNTYPDTAFARVYGCPVDARFRDEAYRVSIGSAWHYWAANCGVHRSMWEKVGPYDAKTFRGYGWEDVDWGFRFVQASGTIKLDPELETLHRAASTTAAIRLARAADSGAAARAFDRKHGTSSLPELSGAWGRAVELAASRPTSAWASHVDSWLSRVPPAVGRKTIDFAIQVEFRRGYLNGGSINR
jgi:glycosyltransferase involved in cell wall biosynthesis